MEYKLISFLHVLSTLNQYLREIETYMDTYLHTYMDAKSINIHQVPCLERDSCCLHGLAFFGMGGILHEADC